jgi:hypothetical protein
MGTFSDLVANSWLDALCRNTSYSEAAVWVKLHLGDPGAAGTANPAAETTREQATFGAAATSRAIANTAAVEWLAVSTTEIYTHVSLWDASSGGNFLGSDDLSSSAAVTSGQDFDIPAGDLTMNIN